MSQGTGRSSTSSRCSQKTHLCYLLFLLTKPAQLPAWMVFKPANLWICCLPWRTLTRTMTWNRFSLSKAQFQLLITCLYLILPGMFNHQNSKKRMKFPNQRINRIQMPITLLKLLARISLCLNVPSARNLKK